MSTYNGWIVVDILSKKRYNEEVCKAWCREHLGPPGTSWHFDEAYYIIAFQHEEDAVAFKLAV